MFKTFRSLLHSIKTVDNYVLEGRKLGEIHNQRIRKIAEATLNGEQEWFLHLTEKDPECVLKVLKECDDDTNNL